MFVRNNVMDLFSPPSCKSIQLLLPYGYYYFSAMKVPM